MEDCGCEERQAKLNEYFPGKDVAMSAEDAKLYEELLPGIQNHRLDRQQSKAFFGIYNRTFHANAKPCSCPGKNQRLARHLARAYDLRCEL